MIGQANAGKTTLLQRVCNTTEDPCIYDDDKNLVSIQRPDDEFCFWRCQLAWTYLSPSYSCIKHTGLVVRISGDFFVGTVLYLIRAVMTPPAVSIPRVRGAKSRRRSWVYSKVSPRGWQPILQHNRRQPHRVDTLVGLLAIEEVWRYEEYDRKGHELTKWRSRCLQKVEFDGCLGSRIESTLGTFTSS